MTEKTCQRCRRSGGRRQPTRASRRPHIDGFPNPAAKGIYFFVAWGLDCHISNEVVDLQVSGA